MNKSIDASSVQAVLLSPELSEANHEYL